MTTEIVAELKESSRVGGGGGRSTIEVVRWKPGAREKAERGNQAAASMRRLQLLVRASLLRCVVVPLRCGFRCGCCGRARARDRACVCACWHPTWFLF